MLGVIALVSAIGTTPHTRTYVAANVAAYAGTDVPADIPTRSPYYAHVYFKQDLFEGARADIQANSEVALVVRPSK